MRPPSRSRRLTSPGRIGIEPHPVPAPRERPAPGRDAVAAGCSGEHRHAAAAADGAGQARASSPSTPPVRSAPIAQHRRSPSAPGSGSDHLRPLAAKHLVEAAGELGVVVAHRESDRQLLLLQANREVSCLLGDPRRVGGGRDPGDHDLPGAEVNEEQHVQRLEPDCLHGEEVRGHDPLGLCFQKLCPCGPAASWRRTQPMPSQQRPDRGGTHSDAELAPSRVLSGIRRMSAATSGSIGGLPDLRLFG